MIAGAEKPPTNLLPIQCKSQSAPAEHLREQENVFTECRLMRSPTFAGLNRRRPPEKFLPDGFCLMTAPGLRVPRRVSTRTFERLLIFRGLRAFWGPVIFVFAVSCCCFWDLCDL